MKGGSVTVMVRLRRIMGELHSCSVGTMFTTKKCLYRAIIHAFDSVGLHCSWSIPLALGAGGLVWTNSLSVSFPWILKGWLTSEVCWFFWMRIKLHKLQKLTSPPFMSRSERLILWERCLKWAPDKRNFVRSWLYNVDFDRISHADCTSWIAWGLWGKRLEDMTLQVTLFLQHRDEYLADRSLCVGSGRTVPFGQYGGGCVRAQVPSPHLLAPSPSLPRPALPRHPPLCAVHHWRAVALRGAARGGKDGGGTMPAVVGGQWGSERATRSERTPPPRRCRFPRSAESAPSLRCGSFTLEPISCRSYIMYIYIYI
jgi:hypothetical protein